MKKLSDTHVELRGEVKNPPPEQSVIVQTPIYRCLGFMDRKGQWRLAYDRSPLPQVLDWWPIE